MSPSPECVQGNAQVPGLLLRSLLQSLQPGEALGEWNPKRQEAQPGLSPGLSATTTLWEPDALLTVPSCHTHWWVHSSKAMHAALLIPVPLNPGSALWDWHVPCKREEVKGR